MITDELEEWFENFPRYSDVWSNGYEAGYKQACKDVKTEQLTMSDVFDERLAAGQLELPPQFLGEEPF